MIKPLILLLLFVTACHQKDDNTNVFLDEGLKRCNLYLSLYNEKYISEIKGYCFANPQKGKPIKTRIKDISIMTGKVLKRNGTDFYSNLSDYKKLIDSLLVNDSLSDSMLDFELKRNFLKSDTLDSIEYGLHKAKILTINYYVLKYTIDSLTEQSLIPNKFEVVIVPEKTILYKGEKFYAKIFLSAFDPKYNPIIIIKDDTLNTSNGKATFIYDKTTTIGRYLFDGRFIIGKRGEELIVYPFNIDFTIVEK